MQPLKPTKEDIFHVEGFVLIEILTTPVDAQSSAPTVLIWFAGRRNPYLPVSGNSTVKEYGISAAC